MGSNQREHMRASKVQRETIQNKKLENERPEKELTDERMRGIYQARYAKGQDRLSIFKTIYEPPEDYKIALK